MENSEESREVWEKELIDVQHTLTFEEGRRSAQIIAKKLAAAPAPIPDFAHLVMLLLSGCFLVVTFLLLSSDIQHKAPFSVVALATSLCLGVAAFRRSKNRGKHRLPHR
ncbi:MAG: hypothetical protein WBV46_14785 [Terriglobales bacterium]|jgi:hypothetical protein